LATSLNPQEVPFFFPALEEASLFFEMAGVGFFWAPLSNSFFIFISFLFDVRVERVLVPREVTSFSFSKIEASRRTSPDFSGLPFYRGELFPCGSWRLFFVMKDFFFLPCCPFFFVIPPFSLSSLMRQRRSFLRR